MPSRPSLGSRQVPDEYPFGPSQAVTTRSRQLEPTASRSMWRRKSRFPHGQVDTVPRGFLVVVDHMLDILARVDSEVSIAMPPVCERRLVVHAAVDAVDRCLELVANEPRAHSGSLTLEMAIGGRCDRRRARRAERFGRLVPVSPRRGPEYPRSDSRPDRGGRFQHSPARSFEGTQQYVERTTVLETTFDTADGTATIRVTEGGADGNPSRRPPSTARTDNGGSTGSRLRRLAVRTDVMEWQSSTASVRYRRLPR